MMADQEEPQATGVVPPPTRIEDRPRNEIDAIQQDWAERYKAIRKRALSEARRQGLSGKHDEDVAEDVAVELSAMDRPIEDLVALLPKRVLDSIRRWHHLARPRPTKPGSVTPPRITGPRSIPVEFVEHTPTGGPQPGQHGPIEDFRADVQQAIEKDYILFPRTRWDVAIEAVLADPGRWPVGGTTAAPVDYRQVILDWGIAGAGDWCRWAKRPGAAPVDRQRRARGTSLLLNLAAVELGYAGALPDLAVAVLRALEPDTLHHIAALWETPTMVFSKAGALREGLCVKLILGAWEASN